MTEIGENPQKIWSSGKLELQRMVLKLTFTDRLTYIKNEGFRTPNLSSPFKALGGYLEGEKEMVRLEGESSNVLFEDLADWEEQLKHSDIDTVLGLEAPCP